MEHATLTSEDFCSTDKMNQRTMVVPVEDMENVLVETTTANSEHGFMLVKVAKEIKKQCLSPF